MISALIFLTAVAAIERDGTTQTLVAIVFTIAAGALVILNVGWPA